MPGILSPISGTKHALPFVQFPSGSPLSTTPLPQAEEL
jgi:hypothetical protein